MEHNVKGYGAVILSATVFGCLPLLAKLIYAGGGTAFNTVLLRFTLTLPVIWIILRSRRISMSITKSELFQLIQISLFGYGITTLLLFSSYGYIPSGMATTIHFTYPIFVILGCAIFCKEQMNKVRLLSVLLCSGGVALFYHGDSSGSLLGFLLAFISGITYAYYMIRLEKSGLNEMHPLKLTFYLNLISSALVLAFNLGTGNLTFHLTPAAWLLTAVLSLVSTLIAVTFLQIGVGIIGPQSAAILSTFEPITSVVLGIAILGEPFTLKIAAGCVFVLSAVILTTVFPAKPPIDSNERPPSC